MKPNFSVLIANYNSGSFFKDCHKSLIQQTETNWEAVILDDCSTDHSLSFIKEIIGDDSRFRIFQNEKNKGVGVTKGKLINLAEAEIFGFVDIDDAIVPEALKTVLTVHKNNPEVGLVYSNFIFCDENLKPGLVHKGKQITALDESYYNFNSEISHFATIKKHFYNKTEGMNPFLKIAEDKDLYMKMCEVAPVKYIDEELYLYRRFGDSVSGDYRKNIYWHWVALMKMAERRNLNLEDYFHEKITEQYVLPKVKPFENSLAFKLYRMEKKLKSFFKK